MTEVGNFGMDALIPIVNKLHDVFTQLGPNVEFDLPQIAVVGGQSAGKSSVLENFVGRDFLPRGTGIVTRRPLILQLIHSPNGEWGEFLHAKGKKFTKFEDIRAEIEADTTRITGTNKGISNIPINLRIHSPHVLNITLIDLPGLTKNPIGDQPEDIEVQIRDMIFEYISKDTCLILAVTPANIDLGTSDALKLAKMADPEGMRTIGVITKLDIMDAGTDAKEILENKCLPLRRGYIGVVNRSQRDIDGKKDIRSAQEAEKTFFQTHPAYKKMATKMGTTYLQKVLNEQLTAHIRECLPALRAKLRKEQAELGKEVAEQHLDDPTYKTKALHQLIHKLQSDFRGTIRGYGPVGTTEISGGVKISYIFHEMLSAELQSLKPNENDLRREISYAVRNSHGVEMGIFTPNSAFQTVVKGQIARLTNPALACVDLASREFSKTVLGLGCIDRVRSYPLLYSEIEYLISNHIHRQKQTCKDMILQLLESESSYINAKHEEFANCIAMATAHADAIVTASSTNQPENKMVTSSATPPPAMAMSQAPMLKGYLSIINNTFLALKGGAKYYWFVLSSESLTWYKDDSELEKRNEVTLEGLHIRGDDKNNTFVLFCQDGRGISKEYKQLVLSCDNDTESWIQCFRRAGVRLYTGTKFFQDLDNSETTTTQTVMNTNTNGHGISSAKSFTDSQLDHQVETIRFLVDSYLKIVTRTIRDLVPKFIMNFVIKKTQDFLDEELLGEIQALDPMSLMAESSEELKRRSTLLRTYKACTESLQILNEISLATSGVNGTSSHAQGRLMSSALMESGQVVTPPIVPRRPLLGQ